jgi:hypothetical protein
MRAGVWRLLDMLRARDLKATFFVPALDAEGNPAQVEAILKDGHEVARAAMRSRTTASSGTTSARCSSARTARSRR